MPSRKTDGVDYLETLVSLALARCGFCGGTACLACAAKVGADAIAEALVLLTGSNKILAKAFLHANGDDDMGLGHEELDLATELARKLLETP